MNVSAFHLQNVFKLNIIPVRTFTNKIKPIKYCGFKYYPRHENFQDPPYTPSKLFLIRRLKKTTSGCTKEELKNLQALNIDGFQKDYGHINVVKNIPEVNSRLWKVKHLVEIRPIVWKGELPEDCEGTFLKFTGELLITPKLKLSSEETKATEEYISQADKITPKYLKNYLKLKWLQPFDGSV